MSSGLGAGRPGLARPGAMADVSRKTAPEVRNHRIVASATPIACYGHSNLIDAGESSPNLLQRKEFDLASGHDPAGREAGPAAAVGQLAEEYRGNWSPDSQNLTSNGTPFFVDGNGDAA